MKQYHFFFFILTILYLTGCSSKTTTYIENITFLGKQETSSVQNETLKQIAASLASDQENTTIGYQRIQQQNDDKPIYILVTNRYLKISFNLVKMFVRTDTNLNDEATYYIEKLIPILKQYPNIIIQVIGHAYDEGTQKEMQHYADLRAISVAELLFNSGLKQEILAKGCSDFIPKEKCNLDKPHTLCSSKNRRVDIFIYTDKADIITKCR